MIAGRKLLLADDSVTVQKVIDLTFSDEGMAVTTVGDGEQAIEKLEQVAPDVVLADVFMPGVNGYELCKFIKQSERFGRIPVMLLVGSFEPFDEAEARRAGADDVVTKPFQSIRQLVGRVGSLLGGRKAEAEPRDEYSALGLGHTEEATPTPIPTEPATQPEVKVFVEAPIMPDLDSQKVGGTTCSTDIEMQTADTLQLPPIESEVSKAAAETGEEVEIEMIESEARLESTSPAEVRKADESYIHHGDTEDTEKPSPAEAGKADQTVHLTVREIQDTSTIEGEFADSLLDLDDVGAPVTVTLAEDSILDIGYEGLPVPTVEAIAEPEILAEERPEVAEAAQASADSRDWSIISKTVASRAAPSETGSEERLSGLSPEAIDAIARRAVEQLSDKVVREIAWEVVPELAELLIKKRLDEVK